MAIEIFGVWFNIFEFFVIPLFILLAPVLLLTRAKIKGKGLLSMYLLTASLFLVSILLSFYGAIDKGAVAKAFLKWIEIFGLSILVFLYCSSIKRFKQIWWLLILILFVNICISLIGATTEIQRGICWYWRLRQISAYSALFLLALILPFFEKSFPIALMSVFLGILVVLSLTRGAWFGLIAIGGYWFWKIRYKRKVLRIVVLSGTLIVLTLLILPPIAGAVRHKIQSALSLESPSNRERLGMAIMALNFFLRHPLIGIGAENFSSYLFEREIPSFISSQNPGKLTPHNFFLQVAAENGIIGLFAILGWLWAIFRILFRSPIPGPLFSYISGLRLFFIATLISLMFGYVAGGARLVLALYTGLVFGTLRSKLYDYVYQDTA